MLENQYFNRRTYILFLTAELDDCVCEVRVFRSNIRNIVVVFFFKFKILKAVHRSGYAFVMLEKYFNGSLPDDVHRSVRDVWLKALLDRYGAPDRRCHGLDDLNDCLQQFETAKSNVKRPNAIVLAIIFRYFEYDPKLVDCSESNINHFRKFSEESKLNMDTVLCEDVISLLKIGATNSTDEHKTEGCYGCEDKHYFLDVDMAILGMGPADYEKYTNHVREEYAFLDDDTYKKLRIKVLESFLQIPNIYATNLFRSKYESVARNNIQREINSLKSGSL